MRVRAGLPLGVSALFGHEAQRRRRLEWRASRALEDQGFEEVILPILDYFAPYESLLAERDKERLYRFVDRDGQMLSLRGDFTPLLARLLAPRLEQREILTDGADPLRLFYRGDVIRHQESGPNRLRESSQLGAEIIASENSLGESELLENSLEVLLQLIGAELPPLPESQEPHDAGSQVEVVLGYAGVLDPLIRACDEPQRLVRALALRDRESVRSLGNERKAALLEILERGVPSDLDVLGTGGDGVRVLHETARAFTQRYADRRVSISIDLAEFLPVTRGGSGGLHHDYYGGPVYRVYLAGAAEPLASGGRYDQLFHSLGAHVIAGGFSIGLDQLLEVGNGSER